MKKVLVLILTTILILSSLIGCKPKEITDINVTTSLEVLPNVTGKIGDDKSDSTSYQGYINVKADLSKGQVKQIKKVTVNSITFEDKNVGVPVIYRYNEPFNIETVNIIYDEVLKGRGYKIYDYNKDQFDKLYGLKSTGSDQHTTKLQYLIMKVDPQVNKEDTKRKVTFTMIYELENGKKIEKPVEVVVPA